MTLSVAYAWRTNAELIADAFELLAVAGLAGDDAEVLDVTYHDGKWWRQYRPRWFLWHSRLEDPAFDFRRLPLEPYEVAAAMAFPAGYIPLDLPKKDQAKLAGNAVTPPVMTWILGRVLQALEAAS